MAFSRRFPIVLVLLLLVACGGDGGSAPVLSPGFTLAVEPPQAIAAGGSGTAVVTVSRSGGHTAGVSLGLESNAQGITGSGDIAAGTSGGTLTIRVPAGVAAGLYALSVTGNDGSLPVVSAGVNVTVTVAPDSPFAIYSPYGEMQQDGGTFATTADISADLADLGVTWIQELPFFKDYGAIPANLHIYSRVGKDAGMKAATITDPAVVAAYAAALRDRIKNEPGVKVYEADTEPDGVGGWKDNPAGYVELLKLTYRTIKEACPDCTVIFGGLSGGDSVLDAQGATFLEGALKAGAAGFFDGMEFKRHHTAAKDYAGLAAKYDSIGALLAKYGVDIASIPVFVETAMYDGDPNDPVPRPGSTLPIQSEQEQARGLIKTYVLGASLGIERIFWNLIYERSDYEPGHATPFPQNPFNHYGLINNPTNDDGLSHKKLAYYAYKKMVELLAGSAWHQVRTVKESDNLLVYGFSRAGTTIYVAWWDSFAISGSTPGAKTSLVLSGLTGAAAQVTEMVPRFATGKEVGAYGDAFNHETLPITDGNLSVTLGENPVAIEILP